MSNPSEEGKEQTRLSNAFASLCQAYGYLSKVPGADPDLLVRIEAQAIAIATTYPSAVEGHLPTAARSGSRRLFMEPQYFKDPVQNDEMEAIATWLTAEDVPPLLQKCWPLSGDCQGLATAFRDRPEVEKAFLSELEKLDVVMNPDDPHEIVGYWAFACGETPEETAFAARLIELMVRKHPDLASSDLDFRHISQEESIGTALILAGALPPLPAVPSAPPIRGSSAHERLKIFKEYGPLEAFLART